MRVLTVDDHASFRDAARALVAATEGFEAVGEAESGEEGVLAARRLNPDLVLMDVHLPDIDGYEAARRITPLRPDTVIVLVSAADDALVGDPGEMCGASVFVRKEDLRPDLLRQIWARHGPPAVGAE